MALDDTFFQDYSQARGDFGGAQAQAPQVAMPTPSYAPDIQQMQQQVAPQAPSDPMAAVKEHPITQFYTKWKGASPEKRKQAEGKLFADVGPVQNVLGKDPTEDPVKTAWEQKKMLEARKEGKQVAEKPPENRWGKFMQYMDNNPMEVMDFMARLMTPRSATQSGAGHALQAGVGALQASRARRAAEAKAGLEGRLAEDKMSITPSEIALNEAKAKKLRADAKSSGRENVAASVQHLNSITGALISQGKYGTEADARIAAQRMISGKASPEEQAYYDILKENLILGATPAQVKDLVGQAPSNQPQPASMEQPMPMPSPEFISHFKGDANTMAQYFMAKKNLPQDRALELAQSIIARSGKRAAPAAPKVAPVRTLDEALSGASKVSKSKQLGIWSRKVGGRRASMGKAEALKIREQIKKEFGSYSKAEADRAAKLVKKIDQKFK